MDVREITFDAFTPDFPMEFDAKWQGNLGMKARIAAHCMTKPRDVLVGIGRDNPEVAFDMLELLSDLDKQVAALSEMVKAANARMLVAMHIANDVPWTDDDETPETK